MNFDLEEIDTTSAPIEVSNRDLFVAVISHCDKKRLYKTQIAPSALQVNCMICGHDCDVKVHKILRSDYD